jgi:cytochrome c oxidase subunit III
MTQEHLANINLDEPEETQSMNTRKFMLWLAIVSLTMFWAAWTSGYLVRKAEGRWHEFELPQMLWYSTGILLISSVSMFLALRAAKKDDFNTLKIAISITFVFGITFLVLQVLGFKELINQKLFLAGSDVASSWLYMFMIGHILHILSGLVVLGVSFFSAFKFTANSKNLLRIELCSTFWHYLDFLWLYLFLFLYFNR